MAKSGGKTVKSIPMSDTGARLNCTTVSGKRFVVSYDPVKLKATLWKEVNGGYEKIAIEDSPSQLEDKIPWNE